MTYIGQDLEILARSADKVVHPNYHGVWRSEIGASITTSVGRLSCKGSQKKATGRYVVDFRPDTNSTSMAHNRCANSRSTANSCSCSTLEPSLQKK